MQPLRSFVLAPVVACAVAAAGPAAAHVNGAGSCRTDLGEYPVLHYTSVRVPTAIANADRGDVILTHGIATNPVKDLLSVLNQIYVHTSMVGGRDSSGTRVTHTTALSIGSKLIEFNALEGFRLKPEWLRRLPPGNVVRDPLDRVLQGYESQCLSFQDPANCMHARSRSHVRTSMVLLKPKPAFQAQAQAAVTWAESQPSNSFGYSVSAYTRLDDAWTNSGIDSDLSGEKPGAMCSSMVKQALNAGGIPIVNQPYSQSDREDAAASLFSVVFPAIHDEVASFAGAWVGYIPPVAQLQLGMANQIVDCFAYGGRCKSSPTIGRWQFQALGIGSSTSPDDLIPSDISYASTQSVRSGVQTTSWATMVPASFVGGQTYQQFSYLECCRDEPGGGQTCRRPDRIDPSGNGGMMLRTGGGGGTDSGDVAVEAVPGKGRSTVPVKAASLGTQASQEQLALSIVRWITEGGGDYVDSGDSYCFVGARGRICVATEDGQADVEHELPLPGRSERLDPAVDVATKG